MPEPSESLPALPEAAIVPEALAASAAAPATVLTSRACIRCSYNLRGLPALGLCPECGTPVEQSLRGHYLAFAAAEYLDRLRRGLDLVLNGILVYLVALVGGLVIRLALSSYLTAPVRGALAQSLLLIPVAMMLAGYWLFTSPDPGKVDLETPTASRRVIRIAIIVQAAAVAVGVLMDLAGVPGVLPPAAAGAAGLLSGLAMVASFVAWVVQFFAVLMYVGWLARRVPDRGLAALTGTYMWLLPLIFVLLLPVLLVGPIIAVGLYWMLLDRLRKHVRAIRRTGMPARLG